MRTLNSHLFAIIIGLFFFNHAAISQEKKALTLDDYGQWRIWKRFFIGMD